MKRSSGLVILCFISMLLPTFATLAQDDATRTAQATESITPSVIPNLPTLTYTPIPAPPTAVPTRPPTQIPTVTPQIEGEAIVNISARIDFPNTIEFFLQSIEPLEAEVPVQLEIQAETLNQPVVIMGTARDFQIENEPERLVYRWQPDLDNAPSLFDTLTYRWIIEQPEEDSIASSEIIFTDPRAAWLTTRLADGNLSILNADRSRARLAANAEQVYGLLQSLTGETPELRFIIYEADLLPPCSQETGTCDGDIYQRSGYIPLIATDALESDVTRLLVAAFYEMLWADVDVPDWWFEGLSRYVLPTAGSQMLLTSQTAERAGQTFSLAEMAERPTNTVQQAQWDAQAYGMTLYLLTQIGRDGMFEFAAMPETTFAQSFQAITGQSLNTLIPAWSRWIFTASAPAVYGLTPYMAETLTPSVTPMSTLTLTPTFTPTETASLTFTFTPDLRTQTEPPTITPLPSATDSPPTATPRSMNVLLTPEPQATNEVSSDGGEARTIVIVTLVLLILILMAVFFLNMRRK